MFIRPVGKRYQQILARSGVLLRLVPTGGAVENLALLRNRGSGVNIALLQGGTTSMCSPAQSASAISSSVADQPNVVREYSTRTGTSA